MDTGALQLLSMRPDTIWRRLRSGLNSGAQASAAYQARLEVEMQLERHPVRVVVLTSVIQADVERRELDK